MLVRQEGGALLFKLFSGSSDIFGDSRKLGFWPRPKEQAVSLAVQVLQDFLGLAAVRLDHLGLANWKLSRMQILQELLELVPLLGQIYTRS